MKNSITDMNEHTTMKTELIKTKQAEILEMKSSIHEQGIWLKACNSRSDLLKQNISDIRNSEITLSGKSKEKRIKKNKVYTKYDIPLNDKILIL